MITVLTFDKESVHDELKRLRRVQLTWPARILEATSIRGQSTTAAHENSEAWLVSQSEEDSNATSTEADNHE